jgi:hypothetical protein
MPVKERTKTAHTPSNDTCQHQFSPPIFTQPPSHPAIGILFPSRAPTPKPNRHLLPRRPKLSDAAACARYRLRKKGSLADEMSSLIHHCRSEAQAYNHLVASSLANLRILLAENERILSLLLTRLPVLAHCILSTTTHTLSMKSLTHTHTHLHPPPLTLEIPPPHGPFHITGDPACRLRSASPANVPLMNC